jgi:small subunit ribosomal protein S8
MITDQIADMLTRIRNAQNVGHPTVSLPSSNTKKSILEVLKSEGYIDSFEVLEADTKKPSLKIKLKYDGRGDPVVKEINRLSTSGRRRYVAAEDIPVFRMGLGTIVVSTSKGMLTGIQARAEGIGGELICSVF